MKRSQLQWNNLPGMTGVRQHKINRIFWTPAMEHIVAILGMLYAKVGIAHGVRLT
jgi:hypothetical protein